MKSRRFAMSAASILTMSFCIGCGSTAPTEQPKAAALSQAAQKQPILYTGKQCFTSMTNMAQRWQMDALAFHMESDLNSEATGQDGKSTVWRAFFASPSRGTMKSFVCSGSRLPSAPPVGITSYAETAYAANVPALVFLPSYFQTDSDKAYTVTLEHGGAPLIKKDPKQPVIYLLDWDPKRKALLWYVFYGTSQADRKGLGVINATTGAFISAGK